MKRFSVQRTALLPITALLLFPLASLAQRPGVNPVSAAFDKDGRSVSVTSSIFPNFFSEFSTDIEIGGLKRSLSSASGSVQPLTQATEATPYGPASVSISTIHFGPEHLDLMLRLGQVAGVPGVLFQAGIRNTGDQPVKLSHLRPVQVLALTPVNEWAQEAGRVYLDPAYAKSVRQDWGKCQLNLAVSGKSLSIAHKSYKHGLGTHSQSEMVFQLGGACDRFHAMVGADDAGGGSMAFEVWADGIKVFTSGVMKKGEPAKEVDVSVAGVKSLRLVVADGGTGIGSAHADWADAWLAVTGSNVAFGKGQTGIMVKGDPADWLITRLIASGKPTGVCALASLTNRLPTSETGGFYRRDGVGFLIAPVGEPIAYLNSSVAYAGNGRASLEVASEMSGVRVDPGETRWGQQAVLLMEKPAAALARQADWVAQTHHARTDKGALSGWCSWYLKTSCITGKDVLGIVDAVSTSGGRLHPAAIQIDDGYQNIDGVWDANAKFSEGLSFYTKKIAATGARPGLWMAMTEIGRDAAWLKDPANLEAVWGQKFSAVKAEDIHGGSGWLDPTHPLARAYIADRIRHAVESGFTYLKLDFNNTGSGGWYEKKRTSFEIRRDHYTNIRNAAGESTYILFCNSHPDRATFGLVDASRTSDDAWHGGIRHSIDQVLCSYHLNGRCVAVDNDCYYLATDVKVPDVGNIRIGGGWPMIHTYASMMGLSSGAAFTSDLWGYDVFKPYWRMTEIMTPPAKEHTEVLDLCTSEEWPRLVSKVQRPWGDWTVALLWNPAKEGQVVTLDFAKAGLDPAHRYAVWSFWDNKYRGIAKGKWTTPQLVASDCQHLVFTDLDSHPGKPVVIGSNLHIFCGAAEIKNVNVTASGIDIELTDAGAREGDLFLFSPKPLAAGSAHGCTVKTVEAAGENVWKVRVEGRQHGQPQKFVLNLVN